MSAVVSTTSSIHSDFLEENGFAIVDGVFDEDSITELRNFVGSEVIAADGKGGVRNLLDFPLMRDLSHRAALSSLVRPVLGPKFRVVRGILFNKTSDANWKVPWHQDVTIAVSHRIDADGYGPWSLKEGVLHVQPPSAILQKMISVRIHLDDCPEENGALRVLVGSHHPGKLPASLPEEFIERHTSIVCAVKSGGVLLMRPLLLHASSAAKVPAQRRVIHFDYSSAELPVGMGWAVGQA